MSCQVAPPSVVYSTTPPSNAVAPATSKPNLWVNDRVTGPAAISGGDVTLASEAVVTSAPNQMPLSAVLRLCAHTPVLPLVVHTVAPASNVSVAELAGLSSVL